MWQMEACTRVDVEQRGGEAWSPTQADIHGDPQVARENVQVILGNGNPQLLLVLVANREDFSPRLQVASELGVEVASDDLPTGGSADGELVNLGLLFLSLLLQRFQVLQLSLVGGHLLLLLIRAALQL